MKIRIKDMVSSLPDEIAEKLVGCEISLSTMANPEGEDESPVDDLLERIMGGPVSERTHTVDVSMILLAIQQKHGETVSKEISDVIVQCYGGLILISTIAIAAIHCEVIPN